MKKKPKQKAKRPLRSSQIQKKHKTTKRPQASPAPTPSKSTPSKGVLLNRDLSKNVVMQGRLTPPPTDILHDKPEKTMWYGTQVTQRLPAQESKVVDQWAWSLLEPQLRAHQKLVPYISVLHTLVKGFGPWWLQKMDPLRQRRLENKSNMEYYEAIESLQEKGIIDDDLMKFWGLYSNTHWRIEVAWARWLDEKYSTLLSVNRKQAGLKTGQHSSVNRKLAGLKNYLCTLPDIPLFQKYKKQVARDEKTLLAIRACLRVYRPYIRPTRNQVRQEATVCLVDYLINRQISKNLAYRATAGIFGTPLDTVRQLYSRQKK